MHALKPNPLIEPAQNPVQPSIVGGDWFKHGCSSSASESLMILYGSYDWSLKDHEDSFMLIGGSGCYCKV